MLRLYPGRAPAIPQFLVDAGVRIQSYSDHRGGLTPDYANPAFVAGMTKIIAAFGARYDPAGSGLALP